MMSSILSRPIAIAVAGVVLLLLAVAIPTRLVLSGSAPAPTVTTVPTLLPTETPFPTATGTTLPTGTARPTATGTPTDVPSATPTVAPSVTTTPAPGYSGYWHTSGNRIVDGAGRTVRLAAVTWFGMENVYYVPAGLDHQPLDAIMARVHDLGFNAIRLPFSNQLVESNPIVRNHLDANAWLQGRHALDILDQIVAAAGRYDLRVILENGRSNVGTPPQENGLWYTRQYPERAWINDWIALVKRYEGNPTVVGVDLRNEPHTAGPGPWSLLTYLRQGSTWGPYRGVSNPATDWRLAAERAGNAVLKVNPNLLIIVEGLQMYPDSAGLRGVDTYWWGGALQGAASYPVRLSVPHRLVYSPHEYGPSKVPMQFFGPNMSYASLSAVWNKHWGYLADPKSRSPVPIFVGEFGTCGLPACVADTRPGSAGLWFTYWMRYLKEHPTIGWSFWALNGTNQRDVEMQNYILRGDWHTVRLPALLNALKAVGLHPQPGALRS